MGIVRVVAAGLALAGLGACGAGGGSTAKSIPAADASALAARADRVAADLAGGACDQALAEARSLQSDIAALSVEGAVRDQAAAGAAQLVGSITCTPTTTVTTVPTLVVDPGPGPPKGKKHRGGDGHD
jgi:hypothetical protein